MEEGATVEGFCTIDCLPLCLAEMTNTDVSKRLTVASPKLNSTGSSKTNDALALAVPACTGIGHDANARQDDTNQASPSDRTLRARLA